MTRPAVTRSVLQNLNNNKKKTEISAYKTNFSRATTRFRSRTITIHSTHTRSRAAAAPPPRAGRLNEGAHDARSYCVIRIDRDGNRQWTHRHRTAAALRYTARRREKPPRRGHAPPPDRAQTHTRLSPPSAFRRSKRTPLAAAATVDDIIVCVCVLSITETGCKDNILYVIETRELKKNKKQNKYRNDRLFND